VVVPSPLGPSGPSPWLARRNLFDRLVCALVAVPLAPVAAVLAALIARDSPGAPVIRLPRVGRGGRPFGLWKLRSMRVAEPGVATAAITVADDDRITPIGRKVRRWRLDELPQLANVVAGKMALIGPRPESPSFVDVDDPRWRSVLAARPAIAGPTQLMVHEWEATNLDVDTYRQDILPVKLAIDAWYVANASPALDLLVVTGLARSLLLGHGDTALHRRVRAAVPEAGRIPAG